MNVLIDMQNLRVVAKHPQSAALLYFAEIEMPHLPVRVEPCDSPTFLKNMTDMELFLFYKSIFNEAPLYVGDKLRTLIMCAVERMKVSQIDASLVQLQANSISQKDTRQYRYVHGSQKPSLVEDLFDLPCMTTVKDTVRDAYLVALGQRGACAELYPGVDYEYDYQRAVIDTQPKTYFVAPTPVPTEELHEIMDGIMEEHGTPSDPALLQIVMQEIITTFQESFGLTQQRATKELISWAKKRAAIA